MTSADILEALKDAQSFTKATMVATRAPDNEDWDARRQEAGRILENLNEAIAKVEGGEA